MPRILGLAVVVVVTGCTSEAELRYLSTLPTEVNGVVFSEDGVEAYVAMRGTTCTIETAWGCPVEDVDLPSGEERIVDHHAGRTLAVSPVGLHQIEGGTWAERADLRVDAVRWARFGKTGPIFVRGDDAGCAFQAAEGEPIRLEPAWCDAVTLGVDRERDALWMADGQQVSRVSPDGVISFASSADLLDHDAATGLTYLAASGGSELYAVDDQGRVVWSSTNRGTVTDIVARGHRGDLLVLRWDGPVGRLERRDGATGHLFESFSLPGADGELVVSENGVGVAIVVEDAVHHYNLEIVGEELPINDQPRSCIDLRDRTAMD